MRVLFVHQNFPGQYKHLAPALADDPANEVISIVDMANLRMARGLHSRLRLLTYPSPQGSGTSTHHYLRSAESGVRRGQSVARVAQDLKSRGFIPDVIYAHTGWGEELFLKDVFPTAKLVLYLEFYYRSHGSDMGFDPEFPTSFDDGCKAHMRNATQLLSLDNADAAMSPMHWQKAQYPNIVQGKISVLPDGIDTDIFCPGQVSGFALPGGGTLSSSDEVITYVASSLEPYRGIHKFLRSLPQILAARPNAQVLIVGGDKVNYGLALPNGQTYKELYLKELCGGLDTSRVHFMGQLPQDIVIQVLRLSSVHIYLTYPFILSWSPLEAMSCGCLLIGSDTAPVQEVLQHGRNGLLVDFHSIESIANTVIEALENAEAMMPLREQARRDTQAAFDFKRVCLPRIKEHAANI